MLDQRRYIKCTRVLNIWYYISIKQLFLIAQEFKVFLKAYNCRQKFFSRSVVPPIIEMQIVQNYYNSHNGALAAILKLFFVFGQYVCSFELFSKNTYNETYK